MNLWTVSYHTYFDYDSRLKMDFCYMWLKQNISYACVSVFVCDTTFYADKVNITTETAWWRTWLNEYIFHITGNVNII